MSMLCRYMYVVSVNQALHDTNNEKAGIKTNIAQNAVTFIISEAQTSAQKSQEKEKKEPKLAQNR